jgi:hypothetical protein
MKYLITKNGTTGLVYLIDDNTANIKSIFNSFFHHGAIGKETKLVWPNGRESGGVAYFWCDGEDWKDKLIAAYSKMSLYKYVNSKLDMNPEELNTILKYYNISEADYDESLCNKYQAFFDNKAQKWFEEIRDESRFFSLGLEEKYCEEYHCKQSILNMLLKNQRLTRDLSPNHYIN